MGKVSPLSGRVGKVQRQDCRMTGFDKTSFRVGLAGAHRGVGKRGALVGRVGGLC